jgi:hypothetical protein
MGDVRVDRWRQRGLVYLWRYRDRPKNYPGWHLAADSLGNESLRDLMDLMQKSPYATECAVSITPATHAVLAVPNYWRGQAQAAVTWRIKTLTGEEHASEWRIDFEDGQVLHTIGSQNLATSFLVSTTLPPAEVITHCRKDATSPMINISGSGGV